MKKSVRIKIYVELQCQQKKIKCQNLNNISNQIKCSILFTLKIINKCLKASQIENKINYLEKKEIDIDCRKENEKEFIKIG